VEVLCRALAATSRGSGVAPSISAHFYVPSISRKAGDTLLRNRAESKFLFVAHDDLQLD
jgi:hypothetical protein